VTAIYQVHLIKLKVMQNPDDPLKENPSSADSSQTMQCETDDSASTIQGLDNELKQTEKKRDLLLKKHHLVSVQREIQVL